MHPYRGLILFEPLHPFTKATSCCKKLSLLEFKNIIESPFAIIILHINNKTENSIARNK